MKESTQSLVHSLVGSSIEFSCQKKFGDTVSLEKTLKSSCLKIERDINKALSLGGYLCLMLMAELVSFYSKQPYYMMIRSSIRLRRYRPDVLDYLEVTVDERAERLEKALVKHAKNLEQRELIVTALGYFLSTYPSRLSSFRKHLTREEFLIVS